MGVYKRGNVYYIDYYFEGNRIRERVGKNKRQAELALASRKGEIAQGKFNLERVKKTPYFEEFAKEYLDWAKINHRSWERMDAVRIKCLSNFFSGRRLNEITPWLIEKFKSERKDKVKPATINRELAVLSAMLSQAIEWGKLNEHPMKGGKVKKLREDGHKEKILTEEEESRLLSVCRGWFKEMVVIALDTGMRLSEIIELKKEDIDLNNHLIKVKHTKSGRERKIPLTERVFSILAERIKEVKDSEFIFAKGNGNKLWAVRSAFLRACKRAGFVGLRFHDLRHTFATRLVTSGIDLATVQKLLGHENIQMTLRYSHPRSEDMKRAIKILEKNAESSHKMVTKDEMKLLNLCITP